MGNLFGCNERINTYEKAIKYIHKNYKFRKANEYNSFLLALCNEINKTYDELARKKTYNGFNTYYLNSLLKEKNILKHFTKDEIEGLFDIKYHTKHIDEIIERVKKA